MLDNRRKKTASKKKGGKPLLGGGARGADKEWFGDVTFSQRLFAGSFAVAMAVLLFSVFGVIAITSRDSAAQTLIVDKLAPLELLISKLCIPNSVQPLLSDIDR